MGVRAACRRSAGLCRLGSLLLALSCGRSDTSTPAPPTAPPTPGAAFAPMIVERFTRVAGNTLRIYWLVSTWNPYTVVKMRSAFTIARP